MCSDRPITRPTRGNAALAPGLPSRERGAELFRSRVTTEWSASRRAGCAAVRPDAACRGNRAAPSCRFGPSRRYPPSAAARLTQRVTWQPRGSALRSHASVPSTKEHVVDACAGRFIALARLERSSHWYCWILWEDGSRNLPRWMLLDAARQIVADLWGTICPGRADANSLAACRWHRPLQRHGHGGVRDARSAGVRDSRGTCTLPLSANRLRAAKGAPPGRTVCYRAESPRLGRCCRRSR